MKTFPTDIELVNELKKGDVQAFDLIYEKYSGKLYSFALKYLRSKADAEELVQSLFLKLWENRKNLIKEFSFKSYLFTIAYNDICKLFRKRHYRQQYIDYKLYQNPLSSFDVSEGIEYKSVLERVQQIINKLPERQKSIFLKSRNEGKSTKVIAAEMNLSPGTVDNYISETLRLIRSRLRTEDFAFVLFFTLYFF